MVLDPTKADTEEHRIDSHTNPPGLGKVTKVYTRKKQKDKSHHEVKVEMMRGDGTEYDRVPIAVPFSGAVQLPRREDLVVVTFLRGRGDPFPIVTQTVYDQKNKPPLAEPADWINRKKGGVVSIEKGGDGPVMRFGKQKQSKEDLKSGLTVNLETGAFELVDGSGGGITSDGQGNVNVSGVSSGPGGGGTGELGPIKQGKLPNTKADSSPAQRAEQAGIKFSRTVNASSTSDIKGQSGTLYVVEGTLSWNGEINLGDTSNIAICGKNGTNATLKVPGGYKDYALKSSGRNVMWSGIDLDQTASGARARLNVNAPSGGFVEYVKTKGRGPDTSPNGKAGPALHVAATHPNGTSRIKNVAYIHGGVFPPEHAGNRPIGTFLAGEHKGTLNMVNVTYDSFPNNGVYATNTSGTVHAKNCEFRNCGVAGYRISHGTIKDSKVTFDYTNTNLKNAKRSGHGVQGIAVEDKGKGSNVSVNNCTVIMRNVEKCGGGIDVRTGNMNSIKNTTVNMGNVGGSGDVIIDGKCGSITDCTFEGQASGGASIVNNGPAVKLSGNTFNYPGGRSKISGPSK